MRAASGPARDGVLNIAAYRFVRIDDADTVAARVQAAASAHALLGTVLVAPEGINLFLAGSDAGIDGFLGALQADARFAGIEVKRSRSDAAPFARLKVKRKREIIAFGEKHAAPLQRSRAPSVRPDTLAHWLRAGRDDAGRRVVLLDTRNREEVAHGTFAGAMTLPIDKFTDFPAALAQRRDALAGATIVGFCTGGIRCEKAVLWMRDAGIDALQLEGGILRYFEEVGGFGYDGGCFVFDQRVALDPALQPVAQAVAA